MARSSSTEAAAPGAYGLAIASDVGLPGLDAPSGSSRSTRHRVVGAGELAAAAGSARLLGAADEGEERIEYLAPEGGGMLVRGGPYGDHLVAADGGEVLSAVAAADPGRWPGHVLGQALPLAASLHGLEVFHAGAVALPDGVLALAGPSGVGKSTLVAALLAAGTAFFTDDVLAVELAADGLHAYPGPTFQSLPGDGAEKSITTVHGVRRRLPLLAFLRVSPDPAATVEVAPCPAERLLETTFDGVSPDPARALRLLEVGAALAQLAGELRFPPGADPAVVAAAILARVPGAPSTAAVAFR